MKSILFVSFSKRGVNFYNDASARYRCIFPAEYLTSIGINTHVVHMSQLNKVDFKLYSHIVFHRPQYSTKLRKILSKARQAEIKIYADTDDFIFSNNMSEISPALLSNKSSSSLAQKQADSYRKALKQFDHVICSTEKLSEKVQLLLPDAKVDVCFNRLPKRWHKITQVQAAKKRFQDKTIRYLPGTSHHFHDFKVVEQWLVQLLHSHPDIKLQIIGELNFSRDLFPPSQVSQKANVSFENLPMEMADSWLTIAPLQENAFNECKSGLKFWESGLMAIPVLASHLTDITRFSNPGLLTSNDLTLWTDFIKKMQCYEGYQLACNSAYTKATSAIFGVENISEYFKAFKLQTLHKKIENQSTVETNNSLQYLVMSANIGAGWPLSLLNPFDKQHSSSKICLNMFERGLIKIPNKPNMHLSKLTPDELRNLEIELTRLATINSKVTKAKFDIFVRKSKKLLNTPQLFFSDSKLFKR